MRNHIIFKFLAVFLAALSLLCALTGGAGTLILTATGLYEQGFQETYEQEMSQIRTNFAELLVQRHASVSLGGCPEELINDYYGYFGNTSDWFYRQQGAFQYFIEDKDGVLVDHGSVGELPADTVTHTVSIEDARYIKALSFSWEIITAAQDDDLFENYAGGIPAVVSEPVEIYTSPSPDSNTSGILDAGTEILLEEFVTVDGSIWGFFIDGWIPISHLTLSGSPEFAMEAEQVLPLTVTAPANLDIFAEPSPDAEVIGMYSAGTSVTVQDKVETDGMRWVFTELGWVMEDTLLVTARTTDTVPSEKAEADASEETAAATQPTTAQDAAPEETAVPTQSDEAEAASPTQADAVTEPTLAAQTLPEETTAHTEPDTSDESLTTEPAATEAALSSETVPAAQSFAIAEGAQATSQTQRYTTEETWGYFDSDMSKHVMVNICYLDAPSYTVHLELTQGVVGGYWALLELLWNYESLLFPMMAIGLMVFAICIVYLCCAAGRKPGSSIVRPSGLNRIPLDLYFLAAGTGIAGVVVLGVAGAEYLIQTSLELTCTVLASLGFAGCLLFVAFFFAFVAQIKTPGGFWWRNFLVIWCIRLLVRLCRRLGKLLVQKVLPLICRLFRAGWKMLRFFWQLFVKWVRLAARVLRWCFLWLWKKASRCYALLPLTWQWLITGFAMTMMLYIALRSYKVGWLLLGFGIFFGIILYGTSAFGTLLESTKRMSKGDLDTKVDDSLMIGSFRDFAENLNDLADVAVVAAQKQLKSERMKTELITNVSHDIKTPLTSIINYVDLLQKPHTEQEQEAYLEVLSRQSHRLKKLIDDLMEMSKASTGNMTVEITKVDAAESVNQALGEFSDKLEKAKLTPVFRHPEETVCMMADGRLVWRVLSNLLGNAVKYALPGTRLYIDLMELEGKVVISLKNISREELNVDAEELLERFVRGDAARNTEGSGLGLNIAQSLTELQKGQLQILVDGDLFKVTLIFPGA